MDAGRAAILGMALLGGCVDEADRTSSPGDSGGGSGGASSFPTAPHTAFPVITDGHGPVLRAPDVALVTFAADPRGDVLRDHMTWLVSSTWLTEVGAEYGVGAGTLAASWVENADPPSFALVDDVADYLAARVADGSLPSPGEQTVYVLHYPATTDIVRNNSVACRNYLAYHDEAMIGGRLVPFVVVPACPSSFATHTDAESAAIFAAQVLVDAATDPFPRSAPGFVLGDQASPFATYGEDVGELCPFLLATVDEHPVPRVWSMRAAAASTDPCVPVTDHGPMFGVTADPPTVQSAAAGQKVPFTLTAWSNGPMAPMHLRVVPLRSDVVAPAALGAVTLSNGEQTTLQLTIPLNAPSQSIAAVVVAARSDDGDVHSWPVSVFVP